jgi:hypothetical protein
MTSDQVASCPELQDQATLDGFDHLAQPHRTGRLRWTRHAVAFGGNRCVEH